MIQKIELEFLIDDIETFSKLLVVRKIKRFIMATKEKKRAYLIYYIHSEKSF